MDILKVGAEFEDLETLEEAVKAYEEETCTNFSKLRSRTISGARSCGLRKNVNPELGYVMIEYGCLKYGNYKTKSKGIRQNLSSFKDGCPVKLRLSLNDDGTKLVVKTFVTTHDHLQSKELYNHYPKVRRSDPEVKERAAKLQERRKLKRKILPHELVNNSVNKDGSESDSPDQEQSTAKQRCLRSNEKEQSTKQIEKNIKQEQVTPSNQTVPQSTANSTVEPIIISQNKPPIVLNPAIYPPIQPKPPDNLAPKFNPGVTLLVPIPNTMALKKMNVTAEQWLKTLNPGTTQKVCVISDINKKSAEKSNSGSVEEICVTPDIYMDDINEKYAEDTSPKLQKITSISNESWQKMSVSKENSKNNEDSSDKDVTENEQGINRKFVNLLERVVSLQEQNTLILQQQNKLITDVANNVNKLSETISLIADRFKNDDNS